MSLEGLTQLGNSLSVVPCTVCGHDCKTGDQISLEFEDKLCFSQANVYYIHVYMYVYILFFIYFFFTWKKNCFSFCNSDCASSLLAMEVCLRNSSEVLPLTYVARVINKKKMQCDFD